MNFNNDNSLQNIASIQSTADNFIGIVYSNVLNSYQTTLIPSTILYGIGSNLTFINYNNLSNLPSYSLSGANDGTFNFNNGIISLTLPTNYNSMTISNLIAPTINSISGIEEGGLALSNKYLGITSNAINASNLVGNPIINVSNINSTGSISGIGSNITNINYNNISTNPLLFNFPINKDSNNIISFNIDNQSIIRFPPNILTQNTTTLITNSSNNNYGSYTVTASTSTNAFRCFDYNDSANEWIGTASTYSITSPYAATTSFQTSIINNNNILTTYNGEWIQIQYDKAFVTTSITIIGSTINNCPSAFVLLASNYNNQNWILLSSQLGLTTASNTFSINNFTSYNFYRVIITNLIGNAGQLKLYQIKFNGYLNTSYATLNNYNSIIYNTYEKQFPPKIYDSVSSQAQTNIEIFNCVPTNVYKQTLTYINHGTYIIYSSSISTANLNSEKQYLFNYDITDGSAHWQDGSTIYQQPNGTYISTNYIFDNTYKGDWIILKLPFKIILTRFRFYYRANLISRSPGLWKCYGSNDGINFIEIVEASNSITSLTSTNYINNGYYQHILASTFNIPYQYICWTVNKLVGGDSYAYVLNFAELQIFGKEDINNSLLRNFTFTSNNLYIQSPSSLILNAITDITKNHLFINASGNIGIGISNLASTDLLTLSNSSQFSNVNINFINNATSNALIGVGGTNSTLLNSSYSNNFFIHANCNIILNANNNNNSNNPHLYISTAGNIGIGTNIPTPAILLDINGHLYVRNNIYTQGIQPISDGTSKSINIRSRLSGNLNLHGEGGSINMYTNSINRFYIDQIGNTYILSNLNISSNLNVNNIISKGILNLTSSFNDIISLSNSSQFSNVNINFINNASSNALIGVGGTNSTFLNSSYSNNFFIHANCNIIFNANFNNNSNNPHLYISTTGNIGIGTSTNLNSNLTINGSMSVSNINATNIQQNNIDLNTLFTNTSNYSCNLLNNLGLQFPPKLYDSVTNETTTTFLGKTVYYQVMTINPYPNGYGIGEYKLYSSTSVSSGIYRTKQLLFNYITNDDDNSTHWSGQYANGIYNSTNNIVSGYNGDWIIIKFPIPIFLTKFRIYYRPLSLTRAPGEWKCYGSFDGVIWNEISTASQMTRLTTTDYSLGYYEKILSSLPPAYLYIGWTINKLAGSGNLLNFSELQIFGNTQNFLSLNTSNQSNISFINGSLRIYEKTGNIGSSASGSLVIEHGDIGGSSSITFPSITNLGNDYAFIKYTENITNSSFNYFNASSNETGALILGCENDSANTTGPDSIIINPSGNIALVPKNNLTYITGNIGIGITNPSTNDIITLSNSSQFSNVNINFINNASSNAFIGVGGTNSTFLNSSYSNNFFIHADCNIILNANFNNNSTAPHLYISTAGNIGIGTSTNLNSNLNIIGSLNATTTITGTTINATADLQEGGTTLTNKYLNINSNAINASNLVGNPNINVGTINATGSISGIGSNITLINYNTLSNLPDLSVYASNSSLNNYLLLSGGTLTGILNGTTINATANLQEGGTNLTSKYLNINSNAINASNLVGNPNINVGTINATGSISGIGSNITLINYNTLSNLPNLSVYASNSSLNAYQSNLTSSTNINVSNIDTAGGIAIAGSTAFYNPYGSVDSGNMINTYINFKEGGTTNDWCYLRQIGGSDTYKLAFDFHDNADARFCIRSINSVANPDNINEVFTVDNGNVTCTGNIGIGITNPSEKLHLSNGALVITGNSTNPGSTSSASFWNQSSIGPTISGNQISFQTNGTIERMRINTSGNIGIGLSSPSYKLHVTAAKTIASTAFAMKVSGGSFSDTGNFGTLIGLGCQDVGWTKCAIGHVRTGSWDRGDIVFLCRDTIDTVSCEMSNEIMRITKSGNIGIGITNPSTNDIITLSNSSQFSNVNINFINNATSNAFIGVGGTNSTLLNSSYQNNLFIHADCNIILNANFNNNSTAPHFYISTTGNIGIGTSTNLFSNLNIIGSLNATTTITGNTINASANLQEGGTNLINKYLNINSNAINASNLVGSPNISVGTINASGLLSGTTQNLTSSSLNIINLSNSLSSSYANINFINNASSNAIIGIGGTNYITNTSYSNNFFIQAQSNIVFNAGNNTSSTLPHLFISTTGNVGIGLTNPTNLLHLQKSGSDNYIKIDSGGASSGYSGILLCENTINYGHSIRYEALTDNLYFSTQDNALTFTNRMTIKYTGNVGIGTTNPNASMELYSTTSTLPRLILSGTEFYNNTYTSTDGIALLSGINRTNNRQLWIADSANLTKGGTIGVIRLLVGSTMPSIDAVGTDGTTRLTMGIGNAIYTTAAGNVGIGITNPQYSSFLLDVRSGIYSYGLTIGDSASAPTNYILSNYQISISPPTASGNTALIQTILQGTGFGQNIAFQAAAGSGNIGIGTSTNLTDKLTINGSLNTLNNNINAGTGTISATTINATGNLQEAGTNLTNKYLGITSNALNASNLVGNPNINVGIINSTSNNLNSAVNDAFIIKNTTSSSTSTTNIRIDRNDNVSAYIGIGATNYTTNTSYTSNLYIQSPTALILNAGSNTSSTLPHLFINPSGNIGIGTSSPNTKLDIMGIVNINISSINAPTAALYGGAGDRIILWPGQAGQSVYPYSLGVETNTLWYSSPNTHKFYNNGVNTLLINLSGNVGIANTNPQFTFQVGTGTSTMYASTIHLANGYAAGTSYGVRIGGFDNGSTGHDFKIQTRYSSSTNFIDSFIVNSAGNIGMGNNINSNLNRTDLLTLSNSSNFSNVNIKFINNATSNALIGVGGINLNTSYQNNFFIHATCNIVLNSGSNLNANNPHLFILSNGNIGIGTSTNLNASLNVNGSILTNNNFIYADATYLNNFSFDYQPIFYNYPPTKNFNNSNMSFSNLNFGNGTYTITASSSSNNTNPYFVFDGINNSINNSWMSSNIYASNNIIPANYIGYCNTIIKNIGNSNYSINGEWIQTQYDKGFCAKYLTLNGIINNSNNFPYNFSLVSSFDNSNWQLLSTQSNVILNSSTTSNTFSINNNTAYDYYRLIINQTSNASNILISEMNFTGTPNSTYLNLDNFNSIIYNTDIIQFPPSSNFTSSSEVSMTTSEINCIPLPYYKQSFTVSNKNNDIYTIYSSSTSGGTDLKSNLFNYNYTDLGKWSATNYSTTGPLYNYNNATNACIGNSSSSSFNTKGDWLIVKFPFKIILNNFIININAANINNAPSLWKCFGSDDGLIFNEITDASQTIQLISTNYTNNTTYYSFTKTLSNKYMPYLYLAWVFTNLIGNAGQLMISELQIFGNDDLGSVLSRIRISGTGTVYFNAFGGTVSDIRYKKNINKIESCEALKIINKLDSITYNLTDDDSFSSGLIAQDVKKILPFLVNEINRDNKNTKQLTLNYLGLIPYLIESVKELYKIINDKNEIIENLQDQINDIKKMIYI